MAITPQDLQDWNSNPVTKLIFSGIDESLHELRSESCLRATADETAMRASFVEGLAEGINALKDGYYAATEAIGGEQ